MRAMLCLLISGLLITGTALAQERMPVEQVCGPAPEQVSTSEKGNLDAKAQTLFKIGSGELQGAAERYKSEIMINPNRSDAARQLFYLKRISCVLIYQDQTLSIDEKLKRIQALESGLTVSEEIRNKLIGSYQIRLGPRGGCNGGRPYTDPDTPAKIVSDGDNLTAYNECGNPTPVKIVDEKTIYFYQERAEIDFNGDSLIIRADDGNSWQKLRN
jgi:hypothetical protein